MNVLVGNGRWRLLPALAFWLCVWFSGAGAQASPGPTAHVAVVEDLIGMLQARPDLRTALERAIARADLQGVRDMDSFLTYLDDLVTLIPNEPDFAPRALKLYYIVNLTPEVGARLQKGDEFGFFLFGGSDIVMVFQNKGVAIDAEVGRKYLQGQRIGEVR
jgi:hypothetical protein